MLRGEKTAKLYTPGVYSLAAAAVGSIEMSLLECRTYAQYW